MGETIFKCIYGIRSAQYVHTSWICANRSHRPKIYLLCTHDGWLAPGCDSVQGKDIILNLDTVLEAKPHLFLWKLFSGILSWTSKKLDFPAMKILGSFLLCMSTTNFWFSDQTLHILLDQMAKILIVKQVIFVGVVTLKKLWEKNVPAEPLTSSLDWEN